MSQDGNQQDDSQESQVDPLKNVKAEMDRKVGNLQSVIDQQNQKLEAILASVQQSMQPASQPTQKRAMKDLLFEDADAAVALIEERAQARAEQAIDRRVQASQASQQAVGEVLAVYPEFGTANSEAANLALQKVSKLPKQLQGTPEGAKMAMMEAAAELGLIPAKARKQATQENDDFVVSQGGGTRTTRKSQDASKDIPEATLQLAQLMGRDITDPKVLDGLRKASKRIYNSYK